MIEIILALSLLQVKQTTPISPSVSNNTIVMYADSTPESLVINRNSEEVVRINLKNGTVTYGLHYTPDIAAKLFWETVGKEIPKQPCPAITLVKDKR
jgi:hypothetical protein